MADPKWKTRLIPVLPDAVAVLSSFISGDLIDRLLSKKCLTEPQYDDVLAELEKKTSTAARKLFQILRKHPPPSFDLFCEALLQEQGKKLHDLLRGESPSGNGHTGSSILPPLDKAPPRALYQVLASVGAAKWEEIATKLDANVSEIAETKENTSSFVVRLHKILESWKLRSEKPTLRELVNAYNLVGITIPHIEAEYKRHQQNDY